MVRRVRGDHETRCKIVTGRQAGRQADRQAGRRLRIRGSCGEAEA